MTPEEFRAAGHQLIDWIADYRATVAERPVTRPMQPGVVSEALPAQAPDQADPEAIAWLLATLNDTIAPNVVQTQSPNYFAWFPANAELASVLGDIASSGLAALGINYESAPALTEVELRTMEWLREALGLAEHWHGAIHDTTSTGTLSAFLAARERASDRAIYRKGLGADVPTMRIYTSDQAHSSVAKGAILAGFGHENIRLIETDDAYAMKPAALAAAIEEDLAAGSLPTVLVPSLGTTGTTAFDPLEPLIDIAEQHDVWVHVDAAMAGSAMLLPEERSWAAGLDRADSLAISAHKWLGSILDTSVLYVRDPSYLEQVFSTDPSYLRSSVDGQVVQFRDWGIPLGRRFRSMKLLWLFMAEGLDNIRTRIRRDLANARWLAEQVQQTPNWELLAPVQLQTLCVRHSPGGLGAEELDAHTRGWAQRINASGQALLTPAMLDGRWMVRISIGALATERSDVERLWALIQDTVHEDVPV